MVLVLASCNIHDDSLCPECPSFDDCIPLKAVQVKGDILDFVGEVTINQTFVNCYSTNIEAKYMFNLDNNSTVTGLTMRIGDRVLVSQISEKTIARQRYEEAVRSNEEEKRRRACLLQKSANSGFYTVCVGNILSNEEVRVTLTYVTQLECSEEGEMKFLLPTNISPKFDDPEKRAPADLLPANEQSAPNVYIPSSSSAATFGFEVDLVWRSRNPIKEVKSLTNDITVVGSETVVRIGAFTAPHNGDFNVLVTSEIQPGLYVYHDRGMGESRLEAGEIDGGQSYLMVTHRIKDEVVELEDAEYVILVDRSGSMYDGLRGWSGNRTGTERGRRKIDCAREAAALFVQSLPPHCSFNVVGFGSSHSSVFPSPVKYTNQTKEEALRQIATFQADMGGTQLLKCLRQVLEGSYSSSDTTVESPPPPQDTRRWWPSKTSMEEKEVDKSKPEIEEKGKEKEKKREKIVLLMTDGDVSNVSSVIQLVQGYCNERAGTRQSAASRVFTIGIGRDVNRFLCERVAAVSNAVCEILVDNPDISTVVARMLDAATRSYYLRSTLSIGSQCIVQMDKAVYPRRFVSFFHKMPTKDLRAALTPPNPSSSAAEISLTSVDGVTGKSVQWTFPNPIEHREHTNDDHGIYRHLRQLYAADLIRSLEGECMTSSHQDRDKEKEKEKEIEALSMEYGVMSDRTAFIVVDEEVLHNLSTPPLSDPLSLTVPNVSEHIHCLAVSWIDQSMDYVEQGNTQLMYAMECRRSSLLSSFAALFRRSSTSSQNRGQRKSSTLASLFGRFFQPSARSNNPSDSTPSKMTHTDSTEATHAAPQSPLPNTADPPAPPSLDSLLDYKNSDGSFAHTASSQTATAAFFSSEQVREYATSEGLAETLAFNLFLLALFKREGVKKYVMIVRHLEKWIQTQLDAVEGSKPLSSLLQSILI